MGYSTGLLNERVSIITPTTSTSAYGTSTTKWSITGTVWAGVTWSKGAKALMEGDTIAYQTVLVRMRWLSGITPDCRLLHDGKYYAITSLNSSKRDNTIQITATQIEKFTIESD